MTVTEFAEWCDLFRQQLLRDGEDSEFLDEWIGDLKPHGLDDAKAAVMHCVRTATKFDVAKRSLPKILTFIRSQEWQRSKANALQRFALKGQQAERGEAWKKSPQRRLFLEALNVSHDHQLSADAASDRNAGPKD